MTFPKPALFAGNVLHRRVHPVWHSLRYRVFSILVDLDDIDGLASQCRLLSHNRWNALSLNDRDHADGETADLAGFTRDLISERTGLTVDRVFMFAFPRVFGHVFNPLTVYFGLRKDGSPAAVIYEVNNTFGGRTHYVCRAEQTADGVTIEQAGKRLLVSPFNGEHGRYGFRLDFDDERMSLGVALKVAGRAILNTSYASTRIEASDFNIVRLLSAMPMMTLKVISVIHLEALKLWLKGLRPPRPLKTVLRGRHDRMVDGQGSQSSISGGKA